MITLEEFKKLKSGDIVLWKSKTRLIQRTVMRGPGDGCRALTFPIRRRSWTGRIYTVYFYPEVKDRIEITNISISCLISPEEADKHRSMKFKKKDFFKEITDGVLKKHKKQAEATWYRCVRPFYT